MTTPHVSIIIPCRAQARELRDCLAAVCRQAAPPAHEVIVIDSEADPAVAAVAAEFPDVRLISDPSGLYPGAARNRGAREARGEWLVFTDADCLPEPGWLAAGIAALQAGAKVAGGAVLDRHPYHPVAASDNLLQFSDFSARRPDGPISHIPTCNFAVHRSAFLELGGFPADVPLCEDGLFSAAAAARWPDGVRFVRAMRVRHAGRMTLPEFWRHQHRFGYYRGRICSRLSRPVYRRWGRWGLMMGPVVCVRLGYVVRKTAQYDPAGLLRALVFLPVVLSGLAVWAGGFRRGCREAAGAAP